MEKMEEFKEEWTKLYASAKLFSDAFFAKFSFENNAIFLNLFQNLLSHVFYI